MLSNKKFSGIKILKFYKLCTYKLKCEFKTYHLNIRFGKTFISRGQRNPKKYTSSLIIMMYL